MRKPTDVVSISTKPTEPKPPSVVQPNQVAMPLQTDPNGKKALATMLYQCFQTLRLYGREPEALEGTVAMFQMILAEYAFDDIAQAFRVFLKRHTEMPTPADIVGLIERDGWPALDRAIYIALQKRDPATRSPAEWAYIRDYEDAAMRGDV